MRARGENDQLVAKFLSLTFHSRDLALHSKSATIKYSTCICWVPKVLTRGGGVIRGVDQLLMEEEEQSIFTFTVRGPTGTVITT